MTTLSMQLAERACAAAEAKARELGVQVSFAVVDQSGRLVLAKRGDTRNYLLIEWAQAKAVASAAFGVATLECESWKHDDPYFWQTATAATRTPMLPSTGAVPLRVRGELLGAIGISGAASQLDHACAMAGAAAIAEA